MTGRKLEQLQNAMNHILGRLPPIDYFNVIQYASNVIIRSLESSSKDVITEKIGKGHKIEKGSAVDERTIQKLPEPFPASDVNIKLAKGVIKDLKAQGATNIYDSLKLAFHVAKRPKNIPTDTESIIIFLTDGNPTVSYTNRQTIINMTKSMNDASKINLYSLGFGKDADQAFLRRISAINSGFMKHIYEASDGSEQIEALFDRVSNPVLANIDFDYIVDDNTTSESKFNILYKGQELFVVGQLKSKGMHSAKDFVVKAKGANGEQEFLPKMVRIGGSGLEKMWAYGKINDLRRTSVKRGFEGKEARDLALKVETIE